MLAPRIAGRARRCHATRVWAPVSLPAAHSCSRSTSVSVWKLVIVPIHHTKISGRDSRTPHVTVLPLYAGRLVAVRKPSFVGLSPCAAEALRPSRSVGPVLTEHPVAVADGYPILLHDGRQLALSRSSLALATWVVVPLAVRFSIASS